MKLFRVYYVEQVEYEEFIEARTPGEAEEEFKSKLAAEELLPKDVELFEFEIEEAIVKP